MQSEYFEVDAGTGRNVNALKKWLISQGMRRYKAVEEHRYDRFIKKDNGTMGKNRVCGKGYGIEYE